jgi:hypothetical protein
MPRPMPRRALRTMRIWVPSVLNLVKCWFYKLATLQYFFGLFTMKALGVWCIG